MGRGVFQAPDFLWDYKCNQKGCCCRNWRVGLREGDVHRLRRASAGTPFAERLSEALNTSRSSPFAALIPPGSHQPRFGMDFGRTIKRDDGACSFLGSDDLCDVHGTLGEDALPEVCQNFPIAALQTPDAVQTSWEFVCPEVTAALARSDRPAKVTEPPEDFERIMTVYELNGPPPVLLVDRVEVAFEELARFRDHAISLLQAQAEHPLRALAAISFYVAEWAAQRAIDVPLSDYHLSDEGYASFVHHLSSRFIAVAVAPSWLRSRVPLVNQFFEHHPWGKSATLEVLERGDLPEAGAAAEALETLSPRAHIVLTNYAIARLSSTPLSNNTTLEMASRQLADIIATALYLVAVFDGAEDTCADHEAMASALSLAQFAYRGRKDAPARLEPSRQPPSRWSRGMVGVVGDLASMVSVVTSPAPATPMASSTDIDDLVEAALQARLRVGLEGHAVALKRGVKALADGSPLGPLDPWRDEEDSAAAMAYAAQAERTEKHLHDRLLATSDAVPLASLVRGAALDPVETQVLLWLYVSDASTPWARALAHVALDYGHRDLTERGLVALFGDPGRRALAAGGRLRALELIAPTVIKGGGAAEAERRYHVPVRVRAFLASGSLLPPEALRRHLVEAGPAAGLVGPPEPIVERVREALGSGPGVVSLAGVDGHDRVALVAAATGRRVVGIALPGVEKDTEIAEARGLVRLAAREALLVGGDLLLTGDAKTFAQAEMAAVIGQCAALTEQTVFVATRSEPPALFGQSVPVVVVELPPVSDAYRLQVLIRALPRGLLLEDAAGIRQAVHGLAMPPDGLVAAARAAAVDAALKDDGAGRAKVRLTVARLLSAMRDQLTSRIGDYADPVAVTNTWQDLQLEAENKARLEEIVLAYRNRHVVLDTWGFRGGRSSGNGITALLYGPPGTGKTMAAGILAAELGLEVFKIDLSRVVDKYIGETEKALGRVFDEAERGEVLLLFDEADSLFGKRTEVKSSTDRYANLEVNYLLQRMESYDGLVVLTTNHDGHLDPAFRRRLKHQVHFPLPDAAQRAQIWQSLIPREAPISGDLDFEELGEAFEMSGGNIKNAVLAGAVLASIDEGSLTHAHLVEGGNREYRALGKVVRRWGDADD